MSKHYTDHAANERTDIAWIRTALAIMAFGFLIEKFDRFVRAPSLGNGTKPAHLRPSVLMLAMAVSSSFYLAHRLLA